MIFSWLQTDPNWRITLIFYLWFLINYINTELVMISSFEIQCINFNSLFLSFQAFWVIIHYFTIHSYESFLIILNSNDDNFDVKNALLHNSYIVLKILFNHYFIDLRSDQLIVSQISWYKTSLSYVENQMIIPVSESDRIIHHSFKDIPPIIFLIDHESWSISCAYLALLSWTDIVTFGKYKRIFSSSYRLRCFFFLRK